MVNQKCTEGLYYGKGGMIRSGFSKQVMSLNRSYPSWGFGSAVREATAKVFAGPDADKAKVRSQGGNQSPGAIYGLANSFGKQALSQKHTSETWGFGTEKRRSMAIMTNVPGPGTYKADGAMGKQALSAKETSARATFGTAPRDSSYKQYLDPDLEKQQTGRWSPPPDTYSLQGALGKQTSSQKESLPSWKQSTAERFDYPHVKRAKELPGAGQYGNSAAIGKQAISHKKSMPAAGFGTSTRDNWANTFISKDHEKCQAGIASPGPGTAHAWSSMGKQQASSKKTAGQCKFGTSKRASMADTRDIPGPGTYCA